MRSQATKPLPKKGALSKTTIKANSPTKTVRKKAVTVKKVKNLVKKSLVKTAKKNTSKDDVSDSKTESESSSEEKSDSSAEVSKAGPSKPPSVRSESPTKKVKKDSKEKKDTSKPASEIVKTPAKKALDKKVKSQTKTAVKKKKQDGDDIKYKINSDIGKKSTAKLCKVKIIAKKKNTKNQIKKSKSLNKQITVDVQNDEENRNANKKTETVADSITLEGKDQYNENIISKLQEKDENNEAKPSAFPTSSDSKTLLAETTKTESERPPKFFTSTRSPRTVDIDVKCGKISKGNLSVSERFIAKCVDPKTDDENKEKQNSSNSLTSQGPEIDVYTFTEKVDSPKSILSDFRNPVNKNIGRVRPIARVKGTIIDKKTIIEKKKFSPHRPIEEVVKQLKAKRGSEELKATQTQTSLEIRSSVDSSVVSDEKDEEEKPKPIISKSYKMVARKSSIPGKPFSPIKFLEQEDSVQNKAAKSSKSSVTAKKSAKPKTKPQKSSISDEDIDNSKFSLNTKSKSLHYSSADDESITDSNDDNDTKESSESDNSKNKKTKKTKKYKRITDSAKKKECTSRELKELSKDSLIDLKDDAILGKDKPSKRRLKLLSMWSGPKKHRMASLNAIAKVHCLYENESRTHMELGLMKTVDRLVLPGTVAKPSTSKKKETKQKDTSDEKQDTTSESEYERKDNKKEESSEDDSLPNTRTLRGVPGLRKSAGKYWDHKSSTSSSEDSEQDSKKKKPLEKKKASPKPSTSKSDPDKPPAKMKKTAAVPVKKKRNRTEVVMDLKDMVVQKRMASLNATAILAASYEKRSPKSSKDETTSDSCSDESFIQKPKNGVGSGVKSEAKIEETKKESDDANVSDRKQKVEVIVNQDTDVTITGVYATHHHEGFCTVAGMQYRISSTSHTQTTATANCEKEGCSRDDGARYTPLTALSSMQPPADHGHPHPHPVAELGGLARRAAGCSSAFSAPSPSAHHEPGKPPCNLCEPMPPMPMANISPYGYFQPAGPLIKETGPEADRTLARYHPPHYHPPHPSVMQQYGAPYYPTELCYGRFYRPPGSYHMPPPPQPDSQMVGVGGEPYPPPQYYGAPPCYQHSPQRVPYIEYRGCPCPMNACPKNVLIGPATGKAPAGAGPDVPSAPAPPGVAFRSKVRAARAIDAGADTHGSGKDPPLEAEPPAAADAPRPCPQPAIGGASPKREMFESRDTLRLARSGAGEAAGPPSPARGSAGACAPQPPPSAPRRAPEPPSSAPRRARLGKAMARRSLAGDDTGSLLSTSQAPPSSHSDVDDDVLAISPPACAPIDLSSSDETDRRSTPLVDVKKENEGPTYSPPRKADTQALKEHNCSTAESLDVNNAAKPAKRRYSRPKLEIELGQVQLDDGCRTNGIGEHVKLQKRRKVSSELNDVANRLETSVTKESKRKPKIKRAPKSTIVDKKKLKRKLDDDTDETQIKKMNVSPATEDVRVRNVAALPLEPNKTPKHKSALLLDNLLRKNSIDRADAVDAEINPAELFLNSNGPQNCTKKTLNINNNVIDNSPPVNGVQPKTIAAVSQLIERKLAASKCAAATMQKVESKVAQSVKTVLKPQAEKSNKLLLKFNQTLEKDNIVTAVLNKCDDNSKELGDSVKDSVEENDLKSIKSTKCKLGQNKKDPLAVNEVAVGSIINVSQDRREPVIKNTETAEGTIQSQIDNVRSEKLPVKRPKLSIDKAISETKCKNTDKAASEKVVKLLVSKKSVIKADEAALVVEDACASPITVRPSAGRRARRRRSGPKRIRRMPTLLPLPETDESRAPPRWSNGWKWDGESHISKVYLNNDQRQDRTARCWSRMVHASGDLISRGDCVLLRAASARAQPFVAKVARLWENPDDGEMMVSLVWYYRPEHTDLEPAHDAAPDEVFASRHRDANSVACIEDKCFVLTFNEYCRYRKRLKAAEEGVTIAPSIVPPMPAAEVVPAVATNDSKLTAGISPELVLFCRKIYDFRSKKIQVPNK